MREFRAHYGEELYRILYRRSKTLIIPLHIIRKTTGLEHLAHAYKGRLLIGFELPGTKTREPERELVAI